MSSTKQAFRFVPNTITSLNLFSGCVAVVLAMSGHALGALGFICLGAFFDFFDGMSARLLGVQSPVGKELDSLADMITFGMAPATILYFYLKHLYLGPILSDFSFYIPFLAYLIAVFSALRLAIFNLDERQTEEFIGIPTPANALFWGSLIVGEGSRMQTLTWSPYLLLVLLFLSCYMLNASVPMLSLKFKKWTIKGNEYRVVLIVGCVLILGLMHNLSGIALAICFYILLSLFRNFRR